MDYDSRVYKPTKYKFFICSENFKEAGADVTFTEEDFTIPVIYDSNGSPINQISVNVGQTLQLPVEGFPGHSLRAVTIHEEIVSVSISGSMLNITGLSEGTAYIGVYDERNHRMAVAVVTIEKGESSLLSCPDDNHPHMIDLGLPSGTKCACCNVGANAPEEYGGYYAWGETQEKDVYNWETYLYGNSEDDVIDIGSDIAGTSYDAATANWGTLWRMPSSEQASELSRYCTSKWITKNGVKGRNVTGTNGGAIFLPAAGDKQDDQLHTPEKYGNYWLSDTYKSYYAYLFQFSSSNDDLSPCVWVRFGNFLGQSVRPVTVGNTPTFQSLQLSSSSLSLAAGKQGSVEITSGNGNYTVQSSNSAVATATINNNTVVISGISAGIATITVTDTQSKQSTNIDVSVTKGGVSSSPGKIVMERKYLVNKANDYCYQSASFRMDNGVQLQIRYNNTDYWQDSYSNSHHGIFIAVGRCEDVNYDWDVPECDSFEEWHIGPVVTDEWVNEKIVIGDDGTVQYFMNGQDMGTHQFDMLAVDNARNMVFAIQPYGWWTGHYHYMDDLKLIVSGATISDNFNDGVIDRNIWQTPSNPEGVREEDGILKTEQVKTDWPFILRSKPISMSDGSVVTVENEYSDMVSTGVGAWGGNGMVGWAGPTVTTADGRSTALAEYYVESTNITGTVLEQTVTGLPNGTYQVKLYANAYYTDGRGFSSDATEGQMDMVYLFANKTKRYIPVHIGTEFTVSDEYTLTANVTDGTLHMGMYSEKVGTNWWTIQIKSLTRISGS